MPFDWPPDILEKILDEVRHSVRPRLKRRLWTAVHADLHKYSRFYLHRADPNQAIPEEAGERRFHEADEAIAGGSAI